MGFKKVVKKGLGSGLNPMKWIGFGQIKTDTVTLTEIFRSVFKRSNEAGGKETFDEAVKRFNLSEEDIQKRIKSAKELAMIFLGFGGVLVIYTIYQLSLGRVLSGLICLTLSLLIFAYGFREHFNMFQMRKRRLGCSYAEWFNGTFKGSK